MLTLTLNKRDGCHADMGPIPVDLIGYDNSAQLNDYICERYIWSGKTGGDETKPKNMNVIFIMRVF